MARTTSSPAVMPDTSVAEISGRHTARQLLIAIRPWQWTKNLIVFAGLLFGMRLFDAAAVLHAVAAFGIFCGLSSSVYLVNDIVDREGDRRHPLKANRPIASDVLALAGGFVVRAVAGAVAVNVGFSHWLLVCTTLLALFLGLAKRRHEIVL